MLIMRALAILTFIAMVTTPPVFASVQELQSEPLNIEKETNNKIQVVKTYLQPRTVDGRVNIWVFFTDKEVYSKAQFDQAASAIALTDRAMARRAKMGLDRVTFADLPVSRTYLGRVSDMGGQLRRVSRWLNAASFSVPLDKIDAINSLLFVAKIRPVAVYSGVDDKTVPADATSFDPLKGGYPQYSRNYGSSLGQLNQINVPVVHELGYDGNGVIVAMLDTGFRKDHEAFADAYAMGRVLAEYDFIFNDTNTDNEAPDASNQHDHGTYTWSTLGGSKDGQLYGPAYGASFILAKTEDMRSETSVEEDNWAAAVEWVDSLGADVISSSLGYSDWYTYADFDGETAITTIAANLATSYGIVVCNSMGNAGPNPGTLSAPADAFEIISCGAVTSSGSIATFSSRGPTYEGRMKPEVCAQGVATYCASAGSATSYALVSGTSLSTPLIGGCAAALLSARPSMTPQAVRLAMMQTASRASSPDNTYGWGIVNLAQALDWGAKIGADIRISTVPLSVSFVDSSYVPATNWNWSFGDGNNSGEQNPVHVYTAPGAYDVSLTITSDGRPLTAGSPAYIIALADTITYTSDTVYAGRQAVVAVNLVNSQDLRYLTVPIDFSSGSSMTLDSFSVVGTRAAGFLKTVVAGGADQRKLAILLQNGSLSLPAGSGAVLRLFFSIDPFAFGKSKTVLDTTTIDGYGLDMTAGKFNYIPAVNSGQVVVRDVIRGDANNDGGLDVGDAVFLISHIFRGGERPITYESGDANLDFSMDVGDAVFLVNYIFRGGPPPNDI